MTQPARLPAPRRLVALRQSLTRWYADNRRQLPWREQRDPYAIWVSEVMLQQTQVDTVIPYFERFLARFPTLQSLASASEDDVLQLWQGLGYYSRARRLRAGAALVVRDHGGRLPKNREALQALPGVGRYTASAIASIAFELPEPIVDGNVTRVLCRVERLEGQPQRAPLASHLWALAAALVRDTQPSEFNQALMELGALVCSPQRPLCHECPWQKLCRARAAGRQEELPLSAPRAATLREHWAAAFLSHEHRLLLTQRSREAQRWPGLWHPPSVLLAEDADPALAARVALQRLSWHAVRSDEVCDRIQHTVTRHRLTIDAVPCWPVKPSREFAAGVPDCRWVTEKQALGLAVPAPFRKLMNRWFARDSDRPGE